MRREYYTIVVVPHERNNTITPSYRAEEYSIAKWALIMASANLYPSGLPRGSLRWTERRCRYLEVCQDRSKHRARFLPEKALCCSCPVCPCRQEIEEVP